ncbi:MAG: hypothetical protein V2A34_02355, partial [Lentisphaerota bacterium]
MKRTTMAVWALTAGLLVGLANTSGAGDQDLTVDLNSLMSRLQSMGHGYHSDADWQDIFRETAALDARARREESWSSMVEIKLIESMVYSDMMNDSGSALRVLEEARKLCERHETDSVSKVYTREAEVYSKLGDEQAISRLIQEFKKSSYYNPESYGFTGGQGRDVPLTVTRPGGKGSDSLTVTTMEMYRNQARFAPGRPFPDFQAVDMRGDTVSLAGYKGKIVLLDFWTQGWEPWRRDL